MKIHLKILVGGIKDCVVGIKAWQQISNYGPCSTTHREIQNSASTLLVLVSQQQWHPLPVLSLVITYVMTSVATSSESSRADKEHSFYVLTDLVR